MRSLLVIAGVVTGICLGFRSMLPPSDDGCGLAVINAMFLGAPFGALVGGLLGCIVV